MSAAESIEQIKALPPSEKAEVVEFVRGLENGVAKTIDSSTREKATERIFDRYDDLFKKLAE